MIVITCPSFSVHGGIRIILEWANRLSEYESVTILTRKQDRPTWFKLKPKIAITTSENIIRKADKLIICSPHHIHLQHNPRRPKKSFIFMQMCEHIFRKDNPRWVRDCMQFYTSSLPMILISNWNFDWIREFGRIAPTYYIGNGVNFEDFPIHSNGNDSKTVLLESPIPSNHAKDVDKIALKVAHRLKKEGYRIVSFGTSKLTPDYGCVPHEHYLNPSLEKINELYLSASVMLKATQYDARSTAPMEAMTKGCVTARAIKLGDDDLIQNINCLRSDYDEEALYCNAKKLLEDHALMAELSKNCVEYVQRFGDWNYWIPQIWAILNEQPQEQTLRFL